MHRSRFAVVCVVLATAVACSDEPGGEAGTTVAPDTTSTVAATTTLAEVTTTVPGVTSTTPTEGADGSGCTPGSSTTLPDGTWFGFVTTSDADSVEFDLACMFTGEAAIEAAAEDGEESPPPNDYYVRNENDAVRVVPVSGSATAVYYPTGDPTGETEGTFDDWRSIVEERGPFFGVWLEVVNGEATAIREQWVP